jgi:hypothetical protein
MEMKVNRNLFTNFIVLEISWNSHGQSWHYHGNIKELSWNYHGIVM